MHGILGPALSPFDVLLHNAAVRRTSVGGQVSLYYHKASFLIFARLSNALVSAYLLHCALMHIATCKREALWPLRNPLVGAFALGS